MPRPLVLPQCICSHLQVEHVDGNWSCQEPSGRCGCTTFELLCDTCRHGTGSHDGPGGLCSRVKRDTKMPCGCTAHPMEMTP